MTSSIQKVRARRLLLIGALLVTASGTMHAGRIQRDAAQVLAFKRHNPCPSTGLRRGSCPGYVVDHVQPLCASGADHPSNMQWQTVADAKAKDREERRLCRELKR